MGDTNEALLKSILRKVHNSEPLNNEERHYREKLFSDMMGSKKIVQKTVRILTGEELRKERSSELRKSKMDADPTRKDPRYTEGKNPAKIKGDNAHPEVLQAKSKILDVDEKPKQVYTEAERLADYTQNPIMPRSEATKFVSLDPVHAGDIVIKNFASSGQMLIKGVVLNVDEKHGTATVKWAHGRTSHEFAHTLVKAKKTEEGEDPKLGVPKAEEEAKNPPMTKKKKQVTFQGFLARHGAPKSRFGRRVVHEVARTGRLGTGGFEDPVGRNLTPKEHSTELGVRTGRAVRGIGRRIRGAGEAAAGFASGAARGVGRAASAASAAGGAVARGGRTAADRTTGFASGFGAGVKPRKPRIKQNVVKGKMTSQELERAKRLAERMKGKEGIDNPHALARHLVQQKFTKAERIEIVNTIIQQNLMEKHFTPKKHPHGKRRGAVGEAVRGGVLGALVGTRRGRSIIDRARRVASRLPAAARRTARRVGRAARRTARKLPRIAGRVAREAGGTAVRAARALPGAARAIAGRHPVGAAALAGAALAVAARRRKKTRKVQKDGDIAASIPSPVGSNMPTPTPFEDLTHVLQQTINLAAEVKTKQNRVSDQDVKEYYSKILMDLRGISESLLASLSSELDEAKTSEDNE